jgi:hypothetical protein
MVKNGRFPTIYVVKLCEPNYDAPNKSISNYYARVDGPVNIIECRQGGRYWNNGMIPKIVIYLYPFIAR